MFSCFKKFFFCAHKWKINLSGQSEKAKLHCTENPYISLNIRQISFEEALILGKMELEFKLLSSDRSEALFQNMPDNKTRQAMKERLQLMRANQEKTDKKNQATKWLLQRTGSKAPGPRAIFVEGFHQHQPPSLQCAVLVLCDDGKGVKKFVNVTCEKDVENLKKPVKPNLNASGSSKKACQPVETQFSSYAG